MRDVVLELPERWSDAIGHIAVKQAATLRWWEEFAQSCDIYVSLYVDSEVNDGDVQFAAKRRESMASAARLDGTIWEVQSLADSLISGHAIPRTETTDAAHIATASVYGMDVLLTWNCRHMANPVTLPKTASIIGIAGYRCPIIITPQEYKLIVDTTKGKTNLSGMRLTYTPKKGIFKGSFISVLYWLLRAMERRL